MLLLMALPARARRAGSTSHSAPAKSAPHALAVALLMLLTILIANPARQSLVEYRGAAPRGTVARQLANPTRVVLPRSRDLPTCDAVPPAPGTARRRARRSDSQIKPRNGHTLIVGIIARISGCADQKEESLEDQEDHAREEVALLYDGPVHFRVIATTGKGEALDRPELAQIEALLRRGELDLLILEDLGRLVRGAEAVRILGLGVDHGTRSIVINDCIDTADENWESDALTASSEHVAHNEHASRRIKKKTMNRFRKRGEITGLLIAGYTAPDDATCYGDWRKEDDATPIIRDGLRILRETLNCAAVADYFNAVPWRGGTGFPPGPYCRRKLKDGTYRRTTRWNGAMVRRFYRNRLLGGFPGRGYRHCVKHHEPGRRKSVRNPNGPYFREEPHLAHVDVAELDEVNAMLAAHNAGLGRKPVNGQDPRLRVPKKRTRWPGQQHQACWYCGGDCVWGGNGMTGNLMCNRSRDWRCWNSIGFNGELFARRVVEKITEVLFELEGFDAQFRDMVARAGEDAGGELARRWEQLAKEESALAAQRQNVKESMKKYGAVPLVDEGLRDIAATETRLAAERHRLRQAQNRAKLELPQSVAELRRVFEEQFAQLATDPHGFGVLMRKLVPSFSVYLVRLCDGGHLLPRARVELALDGICPDAAHVPGLDALLRCVREVDVFEPPQRERIRERAVALAEQGLTHEQIAAKLPERPTATAVGDALALDRKMRAMGLATPYVFVPEPPEDYSKLRRHKNPKYTFEPVEGYLRPPLDE